MLAVLEDWGTDKSKPTEPIRFIQLSLVFAFKFEINALGKQRRATKLASGCGPVSQGLRLGGLVLHRLPTR